MHIPEVHEFVKPSIKEQPNLEEFPELLVRVELVCGAEGVPQPNITWYKDGVILPGEMSRTLIITEVDLSDRGLYRCSGTNFDPNSPPSPENRFTEASSDAVVNIKGIIR